MKKLLILFGFYLLALTSYGNEVLYYWSGAITNNSGKVNAVLKSPSDKVRLVISSDNIFSRPIYSDFTTATITNGNTVSCEMKGLTENTVYYYCFEIDGTKDIKKEHVGSFKTFVGGAFSFKFVAGSCNFFPNNRVYDKMRSQKPLFLLMPGDLHYANPSSSTVEPHRKAYEEQVLQHPRESKFFQSVPIAYIWDDHDFCGDNNDGTEGCAIAAYQAYKEYVPYYPLAAPSGSNAIYQSFTVGRVRFILTDLRSDRKLGDIMSLEQKSWFKNELTTARDNDQLICWMSSVSFSGTGNDNWGGYTNTRKELSNFFKDENIKNLFIISGDAHMLAIDNGTHADFSEGKNNPNLYPILQSAALNNIGSDKGGEYSEGGTFPNPPFSSQWSTIEVTDNGGNNICVRFTCYRMNLFTKKTKVMTSYEFCRTLDKSNETFTNTLLATIQPNSNLINLNLDYTGKGNIHLLNYQGKLLLNKPDVVINKSYQLDATNLLTSGIYYVVIETPKGNFIANLDLNR